MSVMNAEGPETATSAAPPRMNQPQPAATGIAVYLDMDAVLLDAHQGRRGIEVNVQADIDDGLGRIAQIADHIVVLAFPQQSEDRHGPSIEDRIHILRDGLHGTADSVEIVFCPHSLIDSPCDCAKPGTGLIRIASALQPLAHGGWFIGADQQGIQSGRSAGLHTVRVGPAGADHMSIVHKPDYEARDLLDAANHILIQELD